MLYVFQCCQIYNHLALTGVFRTTDNTSYQLIQTDGLDFFWVDILYCKHVLDIPLCNLKIRKFQKYCRLQNFSLETLAELVNILVPYVWLLCSFTNMRPIELKQLIDSKHCLHALNFNWVITTKQWKQNNSNKYVNNNHTS